MSMNGWDSRLSRVYEGSLRGLYRHDDYKTVTWDRNGEGDLARVTCTSSKGGARLALSQRDASTSPFIAVWRLRRIRGRGIQRPLGQHMSAIDITQHPSYD